MTMAPKESRQPVQIVDVNAARDGDLIDRIYHELLEPNFPPDELDPPEPTRAGILGGQILTLAAQDDAGDLLGCVLGYPDEAAGVLLIGYIAVRSDRRSKGVGSALLESARDAWYDAPWCKLVVAEIEDPRFHHSEGQDTERRVSFYVRQGAELVGAPYFQPRLSGDAERIYDMLLIVLAGKPSAIVDREPGRRFVRSEALLGFLEDYIAEAEGEAALTGDSEIDWLLKTYRSEALIPLLPLADYRAADLPRVRA
jgi:GNAT superfamily N-acetyltransferase